VPASPVRVAAEAACAVGWPIAGKLPPEELERDVNEFCRVICNRWSELAADPVPLAAWAEWELNGGSLHPFYDGCGRIARTFSALLLLQASSDLPLYDNLASYFQHGAQGIDNFISYMRDSITRGREWLAVQSQCGSEFRVACYGLIHNTEGQVLLIQRPANKHFPNQWELPGGKLDAAETPGQAVQREAREETGLAVTPMSFAGAVEHEIKGLRVIMLILQCRLDGGEVHLSDEHQAFRWTPHEEIVRMDLTPQLRRFFEAYRQRG
jgi:8-oxo-dGTP diphosphatase